MKNILWFDEVSKNDVAVVGGKGANLGELAKAGIPVPDGFIVTADAYFRFLRGAKIDALIQKTLRALNPEETKKLNLAAAAIQRAILDVPVPKGLQKDIEEAYQQLYVGHASGVFVAVRSSATAEDLPQASFAGQQATFLNISGAQDVVKAVQRCWASLFEPRAIYYRAVNKFSHMKVGIAVPVQKMVQSEKSGVMFTVDPVTSNENKVVIEAGYGLGEAIVSGSITPDRYVVDKRTFKVVEKTIGKQHFKIIKVGNRDRHVKLSKSESESEKLNKKEILELAEYAVKIEKHYHFPQDLEWAIEGGKLYFVQSRPVTTLKEKSGETAEAPKEDAKPSGEMLVKGAAASLGMASGIVKVIQSPSQIDEVQKGDVLVTEMTNPDYVPAMRRAVAIVTDTGGRTSHAAIVSRELGIPCIVGTGTATHALKNGMLVTVDGAQGVVYKGKLEGKEKVKAQEIATQPRSFAQVLGSVPVTGTKVYVNLGEPEKAAEVAQFPADGVGLMRAEFIIANIGEHPKAMLKRGKGAEFTKKLADGMRAIAQSFHPRPVVYRATDFKTNEYRDLKGGKEFEPEEANPMLGYRGAYRYIKDPDVFKLELDAVKLVRNRMRLENLWLMIPFVRTVEELEKVKELLAKNHLEQAHDFKLWMMVEIPSNVLLIDEFLDVGIDGVSFGTNDLTQLMLGIDRDSPVLADEFDERHEVVLRSVAHVIKACRKRHVTTSICGQAPSVYPEMTEFLVHQGITSVSVSPDMIVPTRKLIASVERRILLAHSLSSK